MLNYRVRVEEVFCQKVRQLSSSVSSYGFFPQDHIVIVPEYV